MDSKGGFLKDFFSSLEREDPYTQRISFDGGVVRILESPKEYYNTIRDQLQKARNIIVLSALYIGTGELETRLIQDLEDALEREKNLKVTLIFDFYRAHRLYEPNNDDSKLPQFYALLPLLKKFVSNGYLLGFALAFHHLFNATSFL